MKRMMKGICWSAVMSAALLAGCRTVDQSESAGSVPTVYNSQLDIFPGEDTIPILSWHCITPDNTSVHTYQELKECGFNLSFPHIYDFDSAKKALDCAAAAGVRVMFMCGALQGSPETIVPQVMNHPALAGYHLRDEPHKNDVPALKEANDKIRAIDPHHFTYINLLPIGATESFMPYEEYIRYCYGEIETPFLSYDHYGIGTDGTTRPDGSPSRHLGPNYYWNLEVISKAAREMNKPFWAFALSTAHAHYPVPDMSQLRLQMYSNLAYGAQGLQYFTYWNPGTSQWDFHEAPVLENGKRSHVYDIVRELNAELQSRNFVFMRSKVLSVNHIGKNLPAHTTPLTELPKRVQKLDTKGIHAVVSQLKKNDTLYLVIVNADLNHRMELDIDFNGEVQRVRKDGTIVAADEYDGKYILGSGECEVFSWKAEQ